MQEGDPGQSADAAGDGGQRKKPNFWWLIGGFAVVSGIVLVLALIAPFSPSKEDVVVAAGDATAGASVFEQNCAGCHGPQGAGGGVGPTLAGAGLDETTVANVIAQGRGIMPANIVSGADRDNVVAYVVSIGGGGGEVAAPTTEASAASETGPPASETTAAQETVAAGAGDGDVANGQTLFEETCAGCHGIGGEGGFAPQLKGSGKTAEEVAAKVTAGGGQMPAGLLEGQDLDDVAAYVASISGAAGEQAEGTDAGETTVAEETQPAETAPPIGDASLGEALFNEVGCSGCHAIAEGQSGGIGPNLAEADLTEDLVRDAVTNGRGPMPAGLVQGEDLDNVVAYVLTASGDLPVATAEEPPATEEPPAAEESTATGTGEAPSGNVALTGNGLVGLQVNLEAPAEIAGEVFLVGPGKTKSIGELAVGDSELEVPDAGVGTILDGYDRVTFGPTADQPVSFAQIGGPVDAMRQLSVSSDVAPDGSSLLAAARGQVRVLRDHIRFLKQSFAEGNLINVRFHGEHMVNIVEGEPIVNIDGLGGADNPGDGVGLVGKDGRDGYLPLIAQAATDIGNDPSADDIATEASQVVVEAADAAEGLLAAISANGATCAKAQTLAASRNCVRTIDRLEEQVVQQYRLINRFAARTPIFSLAPAEGS